MIALIWWVRGRPAGRVNHQSGSPYQRRERAGSRVGVLLTGVQESREEEWGESDVSAAAGSLIIK